MFKSLQAFSNRFFTFRNAVPNFNVTPAQCLEWEEIRKEVGRGSGASILCLSEIFQTRKNVDTVNFKCLLWEFSPKISFIIQTACSLYKPQ
jgi:hypothetical protein